MLDALINIWGPVVVSSILSTIIALVVSRAEKRNERRYEIYKKSLCEIAEVLTREITKENYTEIINIKSAMRTKYLSKRTLELLSSVIKGYQFLLESHPYFTKQATIFVDGFFDTISNQKLFSEGRVTSTNYESWKTGCVKIVAKHLAQNPFKCVMSERSVFDSAVVLCCGLCSGIKLSANTAFNKACFKKYTETKRPPIHGNIEAYLDAVYGDMRFEGKVKEVENAIKLFSLSCDKYY